MGITNRVEWPWIAEALIEKPTGFASPYDAGYDAGANAPSVVNCSFKWFTSPEARDEWERGHKDGKASK